MAFNNPQWTIPTNSLSCFIGRIDELDEHFEKTGIMWVDFDDLDGTKNGPKRNEEGTTIKKVIASWTIRAAYAAWINPPVLNYKGRLVLHGKMNIDEMEFKCDQANIKGKGRIKLGNAQLSNVTIAGGPPLTGPVATPVGPGTATIPVAISSASGMATIESQNPMAELEFNTSDAEIKFNSKVTVKVNDNKSHFGLHTGNSGLAEYDIELKPDVASVLPWCTDVQDIDAENGTDQNPGDGDDMTAEDTQAKARDRKNFIITGEHGDLALCMAFSNSYDNLYCVDIFT